MGLFDGLIRAKPAPKPKDTKRRGPRIKKSPDDLLVEWLRGLRRTNVPLYNEFMANLALNKGMSPPKVEAPPPDALETFTRVGESLKKIGLNFGGPTESGKESSMIRDLLDSEGGAALMTAIGEAAGPMLANIFMGSGKTPAPTPEVTKPRQLDGPTPEPESVQTNGQDAPEEATLSAIVDAIKQNLDGNLPAEAANKLSRAAQLNKRYQALIREIVAIPATEDGLATFAAGKIREAQQNGNDKDAATISDLMGWLSEPGRFAWSVEVVGELKKLHQAAAPAAKKSGF